MPLPCLLLSFTSQLLSIPHLAHSLSVSVYCFLFLSSLLPSYTPLHSFTLSLHSPPITLFHTHFTSFLSFSISCLLLFPSSVSFQPYFHCFQSFSFLLAFLYFSLFFPYVFLSLLVFFPWSSFLQPPSFPFVLFPLLSFPFSLMHSLPSHPYGRVFPPFLFSPLLFLPFFLFLYFISSVLFPFTPLLPLTYLTT